MIWIVIIFIVLGLLSIERNALGNLRKVCSVADKQISELQEQIEVIKKEIEQDRKRNQAELVHVANDLDKIRNKIGLER